MATDETSTVKDQVKPVVPVEATRLNAEVQGGPPLSAATTQLLDSWKGVSEAIVSYNAQQGGGHLQNAAYRYTAMTLREMGLDKQGWEVLPAQTGSALDMIGADMVLVNRRTGAVELLDPSSRRLDPTTGEFASAADNAKGNVPRLREAGVIDALPGWFDPSGHLEREQRTPEMSARVKEFADSFKLKIADLTAPDAYHALNLRDFPLPTPTISKQADKPGQDINRVVEYFNKRATEERRLGENGLAGDFNEYARILERGAATFAARQTSANLETTVQKLAERVILEDVVRSLYPQQGNTSLSGAQVSMRQSTADGTVIQVKPDGMLTVNMKKPGQATPEVFTGGSATKAFEQAALKLSLAARQPGKYDEIARELPGHYRKMYEAGKLDMGRVLEKVAVFRAEYSAGGAGSDRTLVGILVNRLATRQPADLRAVVKGEVAATNDNRTRMTTDFSPNGRVVGDGKSTYVPEQVAASDGTEKSRWTERKAPGLQDLGSRSEVNPNFLSVAEIEALKTARERLTAKGNLSPGEQNMVRNMERAERELGENAPHNTQKPARVAAVRSAITAQRIGGPMMLAVVALNLYRTSETVDDTRPSFGVGW